MKRLRSKMKYQGSCHCKAVKFSFESELITQALQCNCSICARKNALMSKGYILPADIEVTGQEHLSVYHWGDKDVNHYFCSKCGTYPFHDTTYEPGHLCINLGCVDDLDISSLKVTHFDGKHAL